jgi:hypothetical protein
MLRKFSSTKNRFHHSYRTAKNRMTAIHAVHIEGAIPPQFDLLFLIVCQLACLDKITVSAQRLVNAVVSMGRRNTQLEPTLH